MDELLKLAEMIKDENLRKKVVEILTNPKLTSKDFKKYKAVNIKEAFSLFSVGTMVVKRDVYRHTIGVTKTCLAVADVIEKVYGVKVDRDVLIAGAILHDLGKLFMWKKEKGNFVPTNVLLDHTILMTSELYKRDFPEKVIHIVASHFGENGPTPPRTLEAWLLHRVDNMLADLESRIGEPVTSNFFIDEFLENFGGTSAKKSKDSE